MASCINKNLPEYKSLLAVYNNPLLLAQIIIEHQNNVKDEEALPSLSEAALINKSVRTKNSEVKASTENIILNNLLKEGIIVGPIKGSYRINPNNKEANLSRAQALLSVNDLSQAVSFTGQNLEVLIDKSKLGDIKDKKSGKTNSVILLSQLQSLFPDVSIQVISAEEAKVMLDLIDDSPNKPSIDKVKSFYHNGVAYLISGRVTNDVAIEEVLHPFVDALKKDNPALFNNLLEEAKKNFKSLYSTIERTYPSEDVDTEVVTQAISRTAAENYELVGGVSSSYKKAYNDFKNWIADILEKVISAFTGKTVIKPSNLDSATSISDLAKMMGWNNVMFSFDTSLTGKVRYSIDEAREPEAKKLFESATREQLKTADILIFKDERNIQLIDTDAKKHLYVDINTGDEFLSVTEGIKGSMSAEDAADKASYLFFGNKFDFILESIAFNKTFEEIQGQLEGLDLTVAKEAYAIFKEQVENLRSDGSILVPQVILHSSSNNRAGSVDILIIHQDGSVSIIDLKTSKNNLNSPQYDRQYSVDSQSSVFDGFTLSTRQQHGIQIGAYAGMVEQKGVEVRSTAVLALQVSYNEDFTKVTSIAKDVAGNPNFVMIEHKVSDNEFYVDQLLDSKVDLPKDPVKENNPVNDKEFLSEEDKEPEDLKKVVQDQGREFTEEDEMQMMEFVSSMRGKLQTRVDALKQLVNSAKSAGGRKAMLHKLTSLLATIDTQDSKKAFFELLKYTKEDLDAFIRYATNPKNITSYDYPTVLNFYNNSFKTYQGFKDAADLLRIENKDLRNMHADIISMLNNAGDIMNQSYFNYVKNLVKSKTRISEQFTDEQALDDALTSMLTVAKDIGIGAYNFDDIGSTATSVKKGETVKVKNEKGLIEEIPLVQDRLLPLVKIIYFQQIEKRNNVITAFEEKMKEEGNLLVEAMKAAGLSVNDPEEIYKFMLDEDSDGNLNGRYVKNIGPQFFKEYYEAKKRASNDEGNLLKYHDVSRVDLSPELAMENLEIFKKRDAFDKFKRPEVTVDGRAVDGEYYKYTDEFKQERSKYQTWDGYSWVKKSGVTDEAYAQFKAKYFELNVPFTKKVFKNGAFTGATIQEKGDFVKRDYVEIREVTGSGKDMRNDKYIKIISDTSALGQARKRFYDTYVDQMENNLLKKLPTDVYFKMLGKVGRMERNIMKDALKRPAEIGNVMLKTATNSLNFEREVYAKTAIENEGGELIASPPIFFVSDLKNLKKIDSLNERITELDKDYADKKISFKKYQEDKSKLKGILKAEESKVQADKLEFDLVKNIIGFASMAENYYQLEVVEDTLNAIGKVMENRKYVPTNVGVSKILKSGDVVDWTEKGKSYTEKRFKKWMEMTFYDDKGHEKSVMDKVTDKLLNATSLTFVGFNIFGNINNVIMGTINNAIETAGGQFYKRRAMVRANKEFAKATQGFLEGIGSKDEGYYTKKKAFSKFEALVNEYRVVRRFESGEGRPDVDWMSFAYLLQEGGEYMVQSKTGVAILMSTMVKNSKTGEEMSLYDAYDFNEQTGKLSLKDGFEVQEDFKANTTLKVYDVNRYIHGNYSYTERTVIQQYWWGKLAMQFHKWVVPAFQARFRAGYDNETLGFVEGRYRTLWAFGSHVFKTKGSIIDRVNSAKEELTEAQVSNMYKVLAELGFYLASFAMYHIIDGMAADTDEDDILTKRLLNAMKYQASKQQSELRTFVMPTEYVRLLTSPIASSRSLREYGEVIEATANLGLYGLGLAPEKDVIYQRTSRKGEFKIGKEFGDAVPLIYTINRWKAYDNVDEFGVYK